MRDLTQECMNMLCGEGCRWPLCDKEGCYDKEPKEVPPIKTEYRYPLFELLYQKFGITPLSSEMDEIIDACKEVMKNEPYELVPNKHFPAIKTMVAKGGGAAKRNNNGGLNK